MNERIVEKIAEMAKKYTEAHIEEPTKRDYLLVENSFLMGAALILQDIHDELKKEREEKEREAEREVEDCLVSDPGPSHENYN